HPWSELGRLLDHRRPGMIVLHSQVDRLKARACLLYVARLALTPGASDRGRRAERGMSGERDLAGDSEDAVPVVGALFGGWLYESRLRQPRLARESGHALVIEVVGVPHHREGVARQRALGEDVEDGVRIGASRGQDP